MKSEKEGEKRSRKDRWVREEERSKQVVGTKVAGCSRFRGRRGV